MDRHLLHSESFTLQFSSSPYKGLLPQQWFITKRSRTSFCQSPCYSGRCSYFHPVLILPQLCTALMTRMAQTLLGPGQGPHCTAFSLDCRRPALSTRCIQYTECCCSLAEVIQSNAQASWRLVKQPTLRKKRKGTNCSLRKTLMCSRGILTDLINGH